MSIELRGVSVYLPVYSVKAKSLRQTLTRMTVGGALFRRSDETVVVQALENVSLSIGDGERVALIGGNGAGKTTLLKTMAGVYTPAKGVVQVKGAVSSALNIGLGMDPELTGRRNIYLLAYYRGISRREVERQIDSIIEATDLGSFIDLPVSTYSTGMTGRLTFAVATAFQPDVLLMDEWLLAGDAQFMNKATARVEEFVSKARIVVLASHSLEIVRNFCTSAALLDGGRLVAYGPVDDVVEHYQEQVVAKAA